MLASLPQLDLILWAAATFLTVVLLSQIMMRGHYRYWPFFTAYLVIDLLHTVLNVAAFQRYGFRSEAAYRIDWAGQAAVVAARTLASVEFCRSILGRFAGVWALAWRMLLFAGAVVLLVAVYYGKDGFHFAVITGDIGSEAFVATFVTGAFLFGRYYGVQMPSASRLLGAGLAFYSCCKILNDLVVSRYLGSYLSIWGHAWTAVFCVTLTAWILAFRKMAIETAGPELHPVEVYRTYMPQMNQRLWALNEQLSDFWKLGSSKP